jgi:hypothetical protein
MGSEKTRLRRHKRICYVVLPAALVVAITGACTGGKKSTSSAAKNDTNKTASGQTEERIVFGRGGGITGAVEEKIFSSTGRVVAIRRFGAAKADTLLVRTLDAKVVAPLLDEYKEKLAGLNHNQTGNAYKYIRYEKAGQSHQITWVDPGPESAKALFDKALKIAP